MRASNLVNAKLSTTYHQNEKQLRSCLFKGVFLKGYKFVNIIVWLLVLNINLQKLGSKTPWYNSQGNPKCIFNKMEKAPGKYLPLVGQFYLFTLYLKEYLFSDFVTV